MQTIELGNICIDVVKKDIKNIHLSVLPPLGKVRVSAPSKMNLDTIRVFTISKLRWIRKQQQQFAEQKREAPRQYVSGESHYHKGKRYLLKVVEKKGKQEVKKRYNRLELYVRPNSICESRARVVESWYRSELTENIDFFIQKWEDKIGVSCSVFKIRKMKTLWGSCNDVKNVITLNLELSKKPLECLEYIVVHELIHLIERSHNHKFVGLMDRHMSDWRSRRDLLNKLPVRHYDWGY